MYTHAHAYVHALTHIYSNSPNTHFAHTCIHICTLTLKHTDTAHSWCARHTHTCRHACAHSYALRTHTSSHSHIHSHLDTHTSSCSHTYLLTHTHSRVLTRTRVCSQPSPTPSWLVCSQAADSTSARRAEAGLALEGERQTRGAHLVPTPQGRGDAISAGGS